MSHNKHNNNYNFNSVTRYIPQRNNVSYKDISLTSHSIYRAEERLKITSKEELRKLASSSKNKGVNLNALRQDTYERLGLTYEEYLYIKGRFNPSNHSTALYLYKGNIFVFCGKGTRTLKTVMNLKKLIAEEKEGEKMY